MLEIIRAGQRHFKAANGLQTYWLFSFSDYYDSNNLSWGALRVFNDDVVQPGAGFPPHPHAEMEIVTLVLEGQITHQDSTGASETLAAGEVQSMSAGIGIHHSEFNRGEVPLHLYQLWLYPRARGLTPSYGRATFSPHHWRGRFLPVASGLGHPGAAVIQTDSAVLRCALDPGGQAQYTAGTGRKMLLYVISGGLSLEGQSLGAGDQARIAELDALCLSSPDGGEAVLVDTPARGPAG